MRGITFRGKRVDNGEWIEGDLLHVNNRILILAHGCAFEVVAETVGQYTGLTDKNGNRIFEGDIVQYNTYDHFDCRSVVKFGGYNQDGSDGEYSATKCIGFYVEVDNFTCPNWCENDHEFFECRLQQNILEVANDCKVIGKIHDSPELLKGE